VFTYADSGTLCLSVYVYALALSVLVWLCRYLYTTIPCCIRSTVTVYYYVIIYAWSPAVPSVYVVLSSNPVDLLWSRCCSWCHWLFVLLLLHLVIAALFLSILTSSISPGLCVSVPVHLLVILFLLMRTKASLASSSQCLSVSGV